MKTHHIKNVCNQSLFFIILFFSFFFYQCPEVLTIAVKIWNKTTLPPFYWGGRLRRHPKKHPPLVITLSPFRLLSYLVHNKSPYFTRNRVHIGFMFFITLCTNKSIGDKHHYLFECSFFQNEQMKFLEPRFMQHPIDGRMARVFDTEDVKQLTKIALFIGKIIETF